MNNDEFPILSEIDSDGNILPIGLNELDRLIEEAMSKPKKNWIAFYRRFLPESVSSNPLDQEVHSYPCEGATPIEAIENLEKSPSTPFRIFLIEVIPEEEALAWVAKTAAQAEEIGCYFEFFQHGRAIR
jgi:hypothetical protein